MGITALVQEKMFIYFSEQLSFKENILPSSESVRARAQVQLNERAQDN